MLVSEEQVAALEAAVAESLGILEMLPATADGESDNEVIAKVIHRYAKQVECIGLAASDAGFQGLQDVCLLFQENLADMDIHGRGLGDAERERLEEWPALAIGYLLSPDDPQASEALLDHLQSPVWSVPLLAREVEVLRGRLLPAMLATEREESGITPETMALEEQSAVLAEPATEPALASLSTLVAEFTEPVLVTTEPSIQTGDFATEPPSVQSPPIIEAASPVEEAVMETEPATVETEPATVPELSAKLTVTATEDLPETTIEAVAVAAEPEPELEDAAAELEPELEDAAAKLEPELEDAAAELEPELEDAAAELEPELEDAAAKLEPELEDAAAELEDEADEEFEEVAATVNPSAARQELLEILCAEIVQLAEAADETLTMASAADSVLDTRSEALSSYAESLERLGEASASIGLTGLQQVCAQVQTNLRALAAQDIPLHPEQRRAVEAWPDLALGYLQALDDRPTCAALAGHLQDTGWPQPLAAADAAPLVDLLVAPKLLIEEPEVEARPRQAQPEDVSLTLPDDVNQDLLDGLLQELPHQAAEFSTAIQRLAAGDGKLKDMEVAQRIAHTLKGAGNTVGVRGIAALTHHVEDILQALSKQGALPNKPLADTLLNAADCLETMSEALLGMSAPPPQALAVLQEVLDWANRIDRMGVPADDEIPPPAPPRLEPTAPTETAPASPQPTAAAPEVALRVSAHLVDNLLRLVGESMILTGQVQERVHKTVTQTRAMLGQNRLFQQLTTELEQLVDIRNVSSPLSKSIQRGDFDPLELEQYNELNTVTHRLVEAATDARELNRTIEDNLAALDALLVDQGRLHRDSQEAVLRTRMVPIQTVVPRLQRSVRQTCRLVDKEAELAVRGAETPMDSNVLNEMVDPLMHILRNAIDHGIEPPDRRKRLGKPPTGRIELNFLREGNNILIHCRDDGAGLDLEAIRQAARERGLLTSDKPLEQDELIRLILLPGFSTRSATTQTSGRGIGMDMVYSRLLDMKGSLRIQTEAGKGCLMEIRLPVTLISTHALLLRMRAQIYALSDRGIEQILHSSIGKIQTLGKATTYQLGNDIHELVTLESLLNLAPDRRERIRVTPPVLLVREETGNIRAVLVDEVVDSRDLVVKGLGHYLPKLPGIVGATILGDGSVAPVLDLPELLRIRTADHLLPSAAPVRGAGTAAAHRQIVLAVDDSLSARRSLAQFVQDAGFEVRTARDGLEAIEIINSKRPDLVLADLEMPRMNGLELTAHLRANQPTHDLPVIMITSRATEKHRREAETVGVNTYLTKPFVEDDLLAQIHKLLRRA